MHSNPIKQTTLQTEHSYMPSHSHILFGLGIGVLLAVLGIGAYEYGWSEEGLLCSGDQCLVPWPPAIQLKASGTAWPPEVGQPYPDATFIDQDGNPVKLSSFKGSVLLIEPIGMTCAACQAFSGAHQYGPLGGVTPQKGLPSIETLFPQYTNDLSLRSSRIEFIQILFYDMSMKAPTADDVKEWTRHFQMQRSNNYLVLAAPRAFQGRATANMIPGFQLVDQDFILRADSTGHSPRHDLYRELLPMVRELL
ncbi:MAG: hypothetical protein OEY57_12155 [Nitrospirota bacterium]|nr:hypothetical protein [Nitrospirota bacterium]